MALTVWLPTLRRPLYPHPELEGVKLHASALPMVPECIQNALEEMEAELDNGHWGNEMEVDYGGGDDEEAASEADEAPNPFQCGECSQKVALRSQFLLYMPDDPRRTHEADFGGRLRGCCMACSKMPAEDFKRQSRKNWKRLATANHKRARRSARDVTFRTLKREVLEEYPSANFNELRHLVYNRIGLVCMAFTASVLKDARLRELSGAVYSRYRAAIQRAAVDSSLTTEGTWQQFLGGGDGSYLTLLCESVLVSYLCRDKACRYFGDNSQWIAERRAYHFRCPECMGLFQPLKWKPGWLDAARVVGIACPLRRTWSFFPASWGTSATENWLAEQALAFCQSRVAPQGEELGAFASTSLYKLSDALEKIGTASCFSKRPFNVQKAQGKISATLWNWDHIQGGYWGQTLSQESAQLPPFTEWDLLIQLVGNVCLSGRAFASRL